MAGPIQVPTEDTVRAIARLVGLELPDQDLPAVLRALDGYVAALSSLEHHDLDQTGMGPVFDPRWR